MAVAKIRFISDNGYENQGFIRRYSRAIFFFMPIAGCQRYCNGNAKPLQTDCKATANRLQNHCKEVAVPLQKDCSITAKRLHSFAVLIN
ncbi:hypothetical protein [uncultured Bacteroides sp.]|uniref:hypothetical protein n=1 Tax=uncultured Bacteroides sp. TaxID=162156 RepID=UPI002582A76E|nr:hypothetical protein [uncultured Bacteroides sp.]